MPATARRIRTLLITTVLLSACGGGGDGPVGNNGAGTFSASIDGSGWSAGTATALATTGGIFTISGASAGSGTGMSMTLYHIGAPGTYPLGVGPAVPGGLASISGGASAWSTPLSGAAGTVTISAVSATRITGTFSYTAPLISGSGTPATRTVTAGQFNLPVTGPATLVVAPNAGSTVSGTLAGTAFNASSIATVAVPASGVLTFAGSNTAQTVNVIISEYTGTGTYALGTSSARHVRLTNAAGTSAWGGTNATASGSVVVTSATTSRVKGTVTATLQPAPGFTGSPVTVTAAFDIGVP